MPMTGTSGTRYGRMPSPHASLIVLFATLSPRAAVRVDRRDSRGRWLHAYRECPLPPAQNSAPWAVYLADDHARFRLLCFDLDSGRGGAAAVTKDLATLRRWLDQAELSYVVAASGPDGGRHVWVTAARPLEALLVRSLGQAAAGKLPTLDWGMLANPRTGAARPIGAPHRDGGHSRLLSPADETTAATRLTPASCHNPPERFVRLLQLMGPPTPQPPRTATRNRAARKIVTDSPEGPHLPGTPRHLLDDDTRALLMRRPAPDRVSETLASLLVRLAVRRWRLPMVEKLLADPAMRRGGLLHVCTSPTRTGARRPLPDNEARRKLARQWSRCVQFAATLPPPADSVTWTTRIADVVQQVAHIQAAADAWPERWATQAGPADRAALDLLCLYALRSGSLVLAMDVRRAAIGTGFGRSTMHRAFARLAMDSWLAAASPDGGPSDVHQLLPITPAHPAGVLVPHEPLGGTQQSPPPTEGRQELLRLLEERLERGRADVFSHGRPTVGNAVGLGHHAGRIYQEIAACDQSLSAGELAVRCGYAPQTTARHLQQMVNLMIVTTRVYTVHHPCPTCRVRAGTPCRGPGRLRGRGRHVQHLARQREAADRGGQTLYRARAGALPVAARILGVTGRSALRTRQYTREILQWRHRREMFPIKAKSKVHCEGKYLLGLGYDTPT